MKRFEIWLCVVLLTLVGCQSGGSAGDYAADGSGRASRNAAPASPASQATPPPPASAAGDEGRSTLAYLNGQPIALQTMQKPLLETAGGTVLAEIILEREVNRLLAQQGKKLTSDAVDRERVILQQSLSDDPNDASRLMRRLRQSRGTDRFERRLRINAGLRLLVQDSVTVTDEAVQQAYRRSYGPAYEARLIVVPTLADAQRVIQQLQGGTSFIDMAVNVSTDVSSARGGLLPPINEADDSYPMAVRSALAKLQPGQVSEATVVENGFAILRLERRIPASGVSFDQVRPQLQLQARRQFEQVLATQRARGILQDVQLTILDPSLKASWEDRREELLQE